MRTSKKQIKPVVMLTPPDVAAWLRVKMGAKTQKQFAQELGITEQVMSNLLNSRAYPGPDIRPKLVKFGMRDSYRVYIVDAE